ncbi:MAG: TonB family protein [Labilithrix sp.]|nr:TonB family protein [Labilithrix sp.]
MNIRSRAQARSAALVCALLLTRATARADEPVLTPPKLVHPVDAPDPREPAARVRAAVELAIDVDRSGAVTGATVTRSAGEALDQAAIAAARNLTFEPATRDGASVSARIRYEYVFAAAVPEATPAAPAPPAAETGSVAGVALAREGDAPLAGASIVVTTDGGSTFRATTDARGSWRIDGVPARPIHIVVTKEGHVASRADETLEPNELVEVKLRLDEIPDPEAFVATARVEAPPREVTKRTLAREELTRIAGTRGDPLRAVELLPGVSRPAFSGTVPILRGANPDDSQVFVEGAPVPGLYHFGGLTSVIHSRVLESVELYPSNFSVRYGRKAGGVIEARLRDPRTDGLHGIADLSLIDSSLVVETPIGDKVGVLAAVRRSNVDAVLNSAASTADFAITAAPVYWDYQTVAAYRPTDQDRIRLLAYGSSDRLAMVLANPADADPSVRGALDLKTVFHNVQLGYRHRFRGGSETNTEVTYSRLDGLGVFGDIADMVYGSDIMQGRSEVISVVSPAVRLVAGLDVQATHFNARFRGVGITAGEGDQPLTFATARRFAVDLASWIVQPAAYLEAGLRPVPTVLIVPGVRADYTDLVDRSSVDPRLSTRWEVGDTTTLKAGAGKFTQVPREQDAIPSLGNPRLLLTKALHVSAGVEQKIGERVSTSVEGFAKWLDDVVTGTPDGRAPFFENSQNGRIFGAELLVRVKPTGRFFGFVSYTLMRSERQPEGGPWRLFDRDQPHILNATGNYRLGRGWEVGASFRYTSGTPYTPVVAATYEASRDVYEPRLGASMSARNGAFTRLDARVEKKWTFALWSLAVYLDVQNVLNSPNREGYSYNYDYTRRQGVRGLPVFPSLGIRGEL